MTIRAKGWKALTLTRTQILTVTLKPEPLNPHP